MSVSLIATVEARLHSLVASGAYPDENAAVSEALDLLERRDRLRAAIGVGLAQLDRGEGIDGDIVFDELEARAREISDAAS